MHRAKVCLADLKAGESGRVLRVSAGWGVQRRLHAPGILKR
jgi:Fe2+ transport system protein FeoA